MACTICGTIDARLCSGCRSAAYCSSECQQADWRTHRLLCRAFAAIAHDDFAGRPSPQHHLAIHLPMNARRPKLVWVESGLLPSEATPYDHAHLDDLLRLPSQSGYVGRALLDIRGNRLRGREKNANVIWIWYLDPDLKEASLTTNQTIHGTHPTLIGDGWTEWMWQGPMVITRRAGRARDPRRSQDVDLTAFRDAIDYLGHYWDGCGSLVDGVGARMHQAQVLLRERGGKVDGVRLNCEADRIQRDEADVVRVSVPRMHPLFNLEGDDPLDIPEQLELDWVAKAYPGGKSDDRSGLHNRLAELLLLRVEVADGRWTGPRPAWQAPTVGSILVVDRRSRAIAEGLLRRVGRLIDAVVVPMLTAERAAKGAKVARAEVLAEVRVQWAHFDASPDPDVRMTEVHDVREEHDSTTAVAFTS